MRIAKAVSITVPADLAAKARRIAARDKTSLDEVFLEALRRYVAAEIEWKGLLGRTRAIGKKLRIKSERDVQRLSDEYRRAKRRA